MNSYVYDIGEKARKISRFVGNVRAGLQDALSKEKSRRKLTQQGIATLIGVNRSVINRQIMGYENLTIRRLAEFAWALGWEIEIVYHDPQEAFENIKNSNKISYNAESSIDDKILMPYGFTNRNITKPHDGFYAGVA